MSHKATQAAAEGKVEAYRWEDMAVAEGSSRVLVEFAWDSQVACLRASVVVAVLSQPSGCL